MRSAGLSRGQISGIKDDFSLKTCRLADGRECQWQHIPKDEYLDMSSLGDVMWWDVKEAKNVKSGLETSMWGSSNRPRQLGLLRNHSAVLVNNGKFKWFRPQALLDSAYTHPTQKCLLTVEYSEGSADGFTARQHLVSYLITKDADSAQRLAEHLATPVEGAPAPPVTQAVQEFEDEAPPKTPQSPAQRIKADRDRRDSHTAMPTLNTSEDDLTDLLGDVFGGNDVVSLSPAHTILDKGGLSVIVTLDSVQNLPQGRMVDMTATITNASPGAMSQFVFQVAPPRDARVEMQAASSDLLPPFGAAPITQSFKVLRAIGAPLRLKIRIQFQLNGNMVVLEEVAENFPVSFL